MHVDGIRGALTFAAEAVRRHQHRNERGIAEICPRGRIDEDADRGQHRDPDEDRCQCHRCSESGSGGQRGDGNRRDPDAGGADEHGRSVHRAALRHVVDLRGRNGLDSLIVDDVAGAAAAELQRSPVAPHLRLAGGRGDPRRRIHHFIADKALRARRLGDDGDLLRGAANRGRAAAQHQQAKASDHGGQPAHRPKCSRIRHRRLPATGQGSDNATPLPAPAQGRPRERLAPVGAAGGRGSSVVPGGHRVSPVAANIAG